MNVLIGCEYSGIIREAFKKRGHNAFSCDLLPSEINGAHYRGDLMELIKLINNKTLFIDLLIAHPPCTRLCNSGVSWLKRRNLWQEMETAALFFKSLLEADIEKICIENPIIHKYALDIIGKNYSQIIQPYDFGEGEQKTTCLWLKNLPPLLPTLCDEKREQRIANLSPAKNRSQERSRTFKGIAEAMAEQWSFK